MIKRGYRAQESQIRHWTDQAVELSLGIDDESLSESIPPIEEAKAMLKKDRRVLVFGGEGCGKSALLAGICNCPVIAKAKFKDQPYMRWRYVCADGDSTNSRFIPDEGLDGLELVDTRSCADADVAETVRGLIPDADVLVAVIDIRNAKNSPVWDILAGLPAEVLECCLLAATFTDKLSAEAALGTAKNLQEFCKERLGTTLRVCVTNPTAEKNMGSFAARVQEILDGKSGVRASIRHLAEKGLDLVRREGRVLNARAAVTRTDVGFLANIEQEIDNFLARQELGTPGLIDNYAGVALKVIPQLRQRLRKELGLFFTPTAILRLEHMAAGTERCLYNMICEEIMGMQSESDLQFLISCSAHWRSVRPRMMRTLACEIGEFPELELSGELATLRTGLCHDLREPFMHLKLRYQLARVFNAPSGWMLVCLWTICLLLFAAGILGFIGLDDEAVMCVGVAFLAWLAGSIGYYIFTRKLLAQVATHTADLSAGLHVALQDTAPGFVVSRVSAYRALYVKPQQTVTMHETMLAPLQERYKSINMQLNANAQRL